MDHSETRANLYCLKLAQADEYIVHRSRDGEDIIYLFDDQAKAHHIAEEYNKVARILPIITIFDTENAKVFNGAKFKTGILVKANDEREYIDLN
jgi:hypothetical protein